MPGATACPKRCAISCPICLRRHFSCATQYTIVAKPSSAQERWITCVRYVVANRHIIVRRLCLHNSYSVWSKPIIRRVWRRCGSQNTINWLKNRVCVCVGNCIGLAMRSRAHFGNNKILCIDEMLTFRQHRRRWWNGGFRANPLWHAGTQTLASCWARAPPNRVCVFARWLKLILLQMLCFGWWEEWASVCVCVCVWKQLVIRYIWRCITFHCREWIHEYATYV